ncbi:MAG: GHKL domain-containing protein [Eubacteriales bacterium]|nr:GHKL domain-containing protein [Eubacteriales bacterium]
MGDGLRIFVFCFLINLPCYLLCCVPFFPKLKVQKRTIITMIAATTLCVAAYYSLRDHFLPHMQWLDSIVIILFYIIYLVQYVLSFNISLPKLLYIFMVVQAYSNIINVTAKYINVKIYPEDEYVIAAVPYSCIILGMLLVTSPLLYRFFKTGIQPAVDKLEDRSFWMLCITPFLFLVINVFYVSFFIDNVNNDGFFFIYILVLLTGFLTYFITFRAVLDSSQRVMLEADMRNMEHQIRLQAVNYRQLTGNIEQVRAARHDMRHHLAVLTGYAEGNDMEGLKAYLQEYLESLPDDNEPSICQNYAVDTIVRYYLSRARRAGAEIDVKIVLPQNVGILDIELCIVFGNLFENAAQSIERQKTGKKFINARCSSTEDKIVITLDNSADYQRSIKPGVGLTSVKAVAERYNGGVRFEQEENMYKSSVLLLIPRE